MVAIEKICIYTIYTEHKRVESSQKTWFSLAICIFFWGGILQAESKSFQNILSKYSRKFINKYIYIVKYISIYRIF